MSTTNKKFIAKHGLEVGGDITLSGTVDGRDLATDGTKLDGVEAGANVTDSTNVVAALSAGDNITISSGGEITATDTNTTYTSSDFNHDSLSGFVANEHLDWTTDRGANNIHANNYTNTTYSVGDGGLTPVEWSKIDGSFRYIVTRKIYKFRNNITPV